MDNMKLRKKYQEFLEAQTHVSEVTTNNLKGVLARFPPLKELNAKWLRDRMRGVSPSTIKREFTVAKSVLKFFDMDTTELERVKLPRIEKTLTHEDLYKAEELEKIWGSLYQTRDKAMFKVLFESACRAGELLSMTFEDLVFEEDGTATVMIRGKTGERPVYLNASVPALKDWLNVHPTKKGPIWLSLSEPHEPIQYTRLWAIADKALSRAGIKKRKGKTGKKRILHTFRHTRITELRKMGITGQFLSRLVGWEDGSNMEAKYVHLSTEDVRNEVRSKVFGKEPTKEVSRPLLSSKTCPKCNTHNDENNVICTNCNMPLADNAIVRTIESHQRREELLKTLEYLNKEGLIDALKEMVDDVRAREAKEKEK